MALLRSLWGFPLVLVLWCAQLANLVPLTGAQVDFVVLTANWHEERKVSAHDICQVLNEGPQRFNCTAFPAWRGSEIEGEFATQWESEGLLIPGSITERRFKFSHDPTQLEVVNSTVRLNSIASGMGHTTIVVSWLEKPRSERAPYLVVIEDDQMIAHRWAIQRMTKPAKIATGYDLVNLSRCPSWGCEVLSSSAVVPWQWPMQGKFSYVEATLYTERAARLVRQNLPLAENYDIYLRRLHRTGKLNPGCTCAHLFTVRAQLGESIRSHSRKH